MENYILKNGRLVDPVSGRDEVVDIYMRDGRIEQIGSSVKAASDAKVVELKGQIVAPGFIDMHVHLREPGYEHKETILTGCTSAAAGGFTAVCCMPNTNPAIDDASVVRSITEKGKKALNGLVDVYPIGAVTRGRKGEELAPIAELVEAGVVAFTDDGDPVHNAEIMRRALEYTKMFKRPIIQHAQEMSMTKGGVMNEGVVSTSLGLPGMPGIAEDIMVSRDIALVEYTKTQYHVAHMSTSGCVDLVREAKRKHLDVTCEVTPHHFTLTDEKVRGYDTNTKMNPPLRTRDDVEAMKEGLKSGIIDVIATDHAPHSYDEKQVEYQYAPFGIVGLETAIGLCITELVNKKIISWEELIMKLSTNPRRILHLPEILVKEGEMANLSIINPITEWVVDPKALKSKSKNTPFGGFTLEGKSTGVVNHGNVYWSS